MKKVGIDNIAVILAGGSGARFGGEMPKQFTKIDGTPLIKITVEKFAKRDDISQIVVVIIEEWLSEAKEILAEYENLHIILGGNTRTQSSHCALKFIEIMKWHNSFVLIHDCARPFIAQGEISMLINAGKEFDAVVLAGHSNNTLYFCENGSVVEVLNRSKIFEAQTPQCFKFDLILSCYCKLQDGENFTDDVSVVIKYSPQTTVRIVESLNKNTKITYKHDVE